MNHFREAINRLTAVLSENCMAYGRLAASRRNVSVRADDLDELLRDWARLDEAARLVYPEHLAHLRKAADEMQAALAKTVIYDRHPVRLIDALRDMRSR
jgi:hypothetical protein